ncbi:MAG: hypothetical protein AAFN74_11925, partial [Myxococcota bacterium]
MQIAVLMDGQSPGLQALLARAQSEVARFGHARDALFSQNKVRVGEFSFETVRRQLAEALGDPEVDVIWAFGPLASTVAVRRATEGRLSKPVLAPFVLAPLSGPLKKLNANRSKLAYIVLTPALATDLRALRATVPIRKVAYVLPRAVRTA